MIIHKELEQGSEEWLQVRLGKITASTFHTLLGNSQTKNTLLYKIASERLTGVRCDQDTFRNHHIDRGHELEDEAIALYEVQQDVEVERVGFVELNEFLGCSPDGLVDNGGVEIKSPDNHTYLMAVSKQYIKPEYRTQCHVNMYVTDAKWWDYVMYNVNFDNPIHVIRLYRDEAEIEKIKACVAECEAKIAKIINDFNKSN